MVRKKKFKFNFNNPKFIDLQYKILKFKDNVYSPKFEECKNKNIIKNNSCFNISIFDDKNNIKIPKITKNLNNKDDKILKITDKIYLKFNKKQKHVLKLWFETNDLMYNTTIKFIKDNFQNMKNDFNNSLEIFEFIEINNKKYKFNLLF